MKKRMWFFLPPALLAALFAAILFVLPPQYEKTYLGGLRDKVHLLQQPGDRPRILLAGGSGAAFSLRSDLLEQELPDYEVINFGLYGGLGTVPMLDLIRPDIRPGDLVILSPEQNGQTLSGFFGPRAMWQAADGCPGLLFRLDGEKQQALWGEALPFAAEKFSFWISGSAPDGDGVYGRDHFNARGDLIADGREGNTMPGGFDPDMPIRFDRRLLTESFIRQVNRFAEECRGKGARVYYRFCPMNASAVPEGELDALPGYEAYLASALHVPLLGKAEDSMLDSAWFFDTNFHLNAAGAVVYTARLAADLKAALGLPGKVSIVLPDPPPAAGTADGKGNGGDADCFLYEHRDGTVHLTALTGEGEQRKKLILPGEIDGQAVTSFDPAVFSGNETIEEIVLPASVRRIENGSFSGCANLKKITLLQDKPSGIAAGDGLLEGTNAFVYVPAASFGLYRTNYFWCVHAERIRPETEADGLPEEAKEADPAEPEPETASRGLMYADANGGQSTGGSAGAVPFAVSGSHLRTNTPLGQRLFRREGAVPLCWNTQPDGSGENIPFGSRTDSEPGKTLYMRWVPQTPEEELVWEERDAGACITGWTGTGGILAIPDRLGGLPVTRIAAGAFSGAQIEAAVLPPSLFAVEKGAFSGCALKELWLYDSLFYIYEESFAGCADLRTLHLSAATSPRYSTSYFGAFADKLDWLRLHADMPKIVLAGGSASRYAYDSETIHRAFPDILPVNMGVYAYTNMLPQYRIMQHFMGSGDILLSAPEFDTVKTQFCISSELDERFWNMAEADYSSAELLDLRDYSNVFGSLSGYLHLRNAMSAHQYEESPRNYDDDGNPVSEPTYNPYGDTTLPRPDGDRDELLQSYRADYTAASFPPETAESLMRVYREFRQLGVTVLFAYAPRNHSALTEESTPQSREALDAALREELDVPFLLPIEESLYPGQLCYLIDNHLTDHGAALHTQKIIRALEAFLGESHLPSD